MSRSAAEKISILERTLSRVLKNATAPRARTAARPAALAVPAVAEAAPATAPALPKTPSSEHRWVTRELDFSPPAAAIGSSPPVEGRAPTAPPAAFAPSPPPPSVEARPATVPPPVEARPATVPPPASARPATVPPPVEARTAPPPPEAEIPRVEVPPPAATADLDTLDEADAIPASERKRSLSQELEVTHGAEDDEEVERQLPPRNFQPEPPPESVVHVGAAPQPAVERMSTRPPPAAPSHPPASSSGEDLEAHVPQRSPAQPGPSDAQLGATIELEEGPHHALELAAAGTRSPPPPPAEEEEVLPAAQAPGRFAAGLRPSAEIAAAQERGGEQPATLIEGPSGDRPTPQPPPPRESQPPASVPRPGRPSSAPGVRMAVPSSPPLYQPPRSGPPPAQVGLEVSAQVVGRPSSHGEASRFVEASRRAAPATFGEMLDDALSLGS